MVREMNNEIKVILIGGSPMSGKTTLAKMLSSDLKFSNISTDDIGVILQTVVDINPMKGFDYREYYIKRSLEDLIIDILEYHRRIFPAIERLIEIHSTWGNPIIIEGWALYPSMLKKFNNANIQKLWLACSENVFEKRLYEDIDFYKGASDEDFMKDKYLKRSLWHNNKILNECTEFDEKVIRIDENTDIKNTLEFVKGVILNREE